MGWVAYKQQECISQGSGAWKSEVGASARPSEDPLLDAGLCSPGGRGWKALLLSCLAL